MEGPRKVGELGALYPPPTGRMGRFSSFVTLGESGLLGGPVQGESGSQGRAHDSGFCWGKLGLSGCNRTLGLGQDRKGSALIGSKPQVQGRTSSLH